LSNSNVLITGASSGFGRETAQKLANDGHHVFASMRDIKGKNFEVAQSLEQWAKERTLRINVIELDVTSETSVNEAVASILQDAGHLDVVVNNAGIVGFGPMEAFSIEQSTQMFNVNVMGPLRVNQAILPGMRKRKSGLIIQIASAGGRVILPFHGVYNATKWAAEAIGEGLHYELVSHGIESVIIEPGLFKTEIMGKIMPPARPEINEEYSEFNKDQGPMFEKAISDLEPENAARPDWIANAVKALVDMPAGSRPLRTVVGTALTAGVRELNKHQDVAQRTFLTDVGLDSWNKT
jgi:NAD(P)-dependent dehydrogenase (short-subunit alcohol dehydrogenase family)